MTVELRELHFAELIVWGMLFLQTRIVGGVETLVNEFPEQCYLKDVATNTVLCSCTISKDLISIYGIPVIKD